MKKFAPLLALALFFGFSFAHAQTACYNSADCPTGQTCNTTTDTCTGAGYGSSNYGGTGSGAPGSYGTFGSGNSGSTGYGGSTGGFPTPNTSALASYASALISFINSWLVPLVISIAFIVFLYGVADAYILHPGSEDKRKEGHQFILWGIIGFVVIFSVWGLVNLVGSTLGLGDESASTSYPQLPTL